MNIPHLSARSQRRPGAHPSRFVSGSGRKRQLCKADCSKAIVRVLATDLPEWFLPGMDGQRIRIGRDRAGRATGGYSVSSRHLRTAMHSVADSLSRERRMVDNTIQSKGAARHLCRAAIVSAQMLLLSPPNDIPGRGQQQHQNRARQECKLRARHDAQQGSEAGRVREGRQQVVDDGVLDHIKAEKCSRQ